MYAFIHSTACTESSDKCQILLRSLEAKARNKQKSCPSGTSTEGRNYFTSKQRYSFKQK